MFNRSKGGVFLEPWGDLTRGILIIAIVIVFLVIMFDSAVKFRKKMKEEPFFDRKKMKTYGIILAILIIVLYSLAILTNPK